MLTLLKSVSALALNVTLFSSLAPTFPASAQLLPPAGNPAASSPLSPMPYAFVPPPNRRRQPGNRTTTGTRQDSCVGDAQTAFTLLAPNEYMGVSASYQPSLSWYLPESEYLYPVVLRVYLPGEEGEIIEATLPYQSGITTYALPTDMPLVPGERYRWQVAILCNENRPSQALVEDTWLEVVAPTEGLQRSLNQATTDAERALAYGREGFWYDAIALVSQLNDPEAITVRRQLLENLASIEESNEALQENILNIIQQESQR